MKISNITLEDCERATGILVAVDVLRAFSTACYAFAAGVVKILLAGTVPDAFALRERFPDALLAGEDYGYRIPGFDLGNSPSQFDGMDLGGRTMILRTTAGTQGIVRGKFAQHLLGCSFCCARGTARYLARLAPSEVTFVITGSRPNDSGDEDAACADYIAALVSGATPAVQPFLDRVRNSMPATKFLDPAQPDFMQTDLDYCLQANRFDWAMVVRREGDLLVMRTET